MNFIRFAARCAWMGTMLLGLGAARAGASTFVVTNTSDTNGTCTVSSCSLREAIAAANANTKISDKITFANTVRGTINLSLTDEDTFFGLSAFQLKGPMEIKGPGANLLTIQRADGASDFRLFLMAKGVATRVSGLTLKAGHTSSGQIGGGIYNRGNLTLVDSVVKENTADLYGGGLVNIGTLNVQGCTIANNVANAADTSGGIDNTGGILTLTNSTFTGNSAPVGGGHSGNGGGVWTSSDATINNCTITNNSAANGASGVYGFGGTITLNNTVVAANANTEIPDVAVYDNAFFASKGYNLIGNVGNVTVFTASGDKKGKASALLNPKLGPLQDNGGPTPTYSLLSGSPARNAGDPAFSTTKPPNDQRGIGYARVSGNRLDIGAFEVQDPRSQPIINNLFTSPTSPKTNEVLTAHVETNRSHLTYKYQWKKNKVPISGATRSTLNLSVVGNGDKGDSITFTATASDSSGTSYIDASAPVIVVNTAPVIASLKLSSTQPTSNSVIGVVITASDADKDSLTYTYQWNKSGVPITGATGATLDLSLPGNGDAGDTISVTVIASDGTISSNTAVSASVPVGSDAGTSPSAPKSPSSSGSGASS